MIQFRDRQLTERADVERTTVPAAPFGSQTRYNSHTLHVCHICLHWGGLGGQWGGIYGIHGVYGIIQSSERSPIHSHHKRPTNPNVRLSDVPVFRVLFDTIHVITSV